jgi:hypothetical protein
MTKDVFPLKDLGFPKRWRYPKERLTYLRSEEKEEWDTMVYLRILSLDFPRLSFCPSAHELRCLAAAAVPYDQLG